MTLEPAVEAPHPPHNVRLDTLVRLRWLAVIGQTAAVLVVQYGLDFSLNLPACGAIIAVSAWLNLALRLHFGTAQRLDPVRATWLLAFDIAQLAALLFVTGGLENPFVFLILGPVLISATALPPRMTLVLGAFAMLCVTMLVFFHFPLPWASDEALLLPGLYVLGIWLSILLSLGFIGVYAWQVAEEGRRLNDALAATELVLAREQHLSQLDGLAAAAAHELGTPLSTITVIAKELERTLEPDSPHAEDVRLLREQAQRCREILGKIAQLPAGGAPFDRLKLSVLLDEVIAPYRHFEVPIDLVLPPDRTDEPVGPRSPGILHGLGNLLENAVDFARSRVEVAGRWSSHEVVVTIADDGPGFAPEIRDRIGEPYVKSARPGTEGPAGLGLGFFIAKNLLERSGAALALANRTAPETGAVIRVRWSRADFERDTPP